jgi:C1A family cysteine protease
MDLFIRPSARIETTLIRTNRKRRISMRPPSNIFASAAVFAFANLIANAQTPPPAGPVQIITPSEFNQLQQSGQKFFPISPAVQAAQNKQEQLTDAKNRGVVEAFIRQNPNLPGIAALANATPTGPGVVQTADGNYTWQIPDALGGVQTIETLGPSAVLSSLADSIQAASNAGQQLALYQSLYSQYGVLYPQLCGVPAASDGCANLTAPAALTLPSALQNASLGAIKGALQTLTSQGIKIINRIPLPVDDGHFASCSTNIGASLKATNVDFGDQTHSSCTSQSSTGLLKNFNWPNKNLLTCVKEQGGRGTCHIFAATSAVEELIARDTGDRVNLSEQDFMEHEKLLWHPNYSHDGGNAHTDLNDAQKSSYQFAYENQWDYNPAHSCTKYPYPSLEPGCSDSTPEAPEDCYNQSFGWTCYYFTAPISNPRSPYMSDGAVSLWDSNADLMFGNILIQLAFNNAVILGFSETDNFHYAPTKGSKAGYVEYDAADLLTVKGGHAVHVVGFIDNATLAANAATKSVPAGSGGGYFIIKNSWGTCAGDDGFYYLPVDYLTARATGVYAVSSVTH